MAENKRRRHMRKIMSGTVVGAPQPLSLCVPTKFASSVPAEVCSSLDFEVEIDDPTSDAEQVKYPTTEIRILAKTPPPPPKSKSSLSTRRKKSPPSPRRGRRGPKRTLSPSSASPRKSASPLSPRKPTSVDASPGSESHSPKSPIATKKKSPRKKQGAVPSPRKTRRRRHPKETTQTDISNGDDDDVDNVPPRKRHCSGARRTLDFDELLSDADTQQPFHSANGWGAWTKFNANHENEEDENQNEEMDEDEKAMCEQHLENRYQTDACQELFTTPTKDPHTPREPSSASSEGSKRWLTYEGNVLMLRAPDGVPAC